MVKFFILLMISTSAFAVCVAPISRTNIGANSVLTSTRYNADVNTAYNRLNNLPGDCVDDATITSAKLATGAVTNAKIADGAITSAKLATGAVPESGRLLRVSTFTASGTWTKQADIGSVLIQVVGGGGASYNASSTNGGASSFGTHCTANGGSKPAAGGVGAGGAGGTATGGDINLTGGKGEDWMNVTGNYSFGGGGGVSMLGPFGRGGVGNYYQSQSSPGGGAGGYCAKLIQANSLAASESVTVGAGGTHPNIGTTHGTAGIVLVYEYAK